MGTKRLTQIHNRIQGPKPMDRSIHHGNTTGFHFVSLLSLLGWQDFEQIATIQKQIYNE